MWYNFFMFSFFKKNILKKSIFLFLIFPTISLASEINFSEVMADPEGTDTNREWIEVKNTANYPVNLEKYKFCDSGSCHKLYSENNNFKIQPKSFGIIAKNISEFKNDYQDFSGFVLRASFSLTNAGEKLELKNQNGDVVSVVEYSGDVCGKNGDSCSLFGDTWKNGKSTPGSENVFKKKESSNSSGGSSSSDETPKIDRTYVEITDVIDGKKKLKAEIIDDIPTLIAGAENEFHGRAYGITGIEIRGAEYFWNMGDGKKEYGKNIKHTFLYPGKYILTLVVKSANFTGNIRKIVSVINSPIEISSIDSKENWIKIKNNYSDILKLDGWEIFVDGEKFKIPKESYILGNSELIFPNKITNLDVKNNSHIFLLFPKGQKQSVFVKKDVSKIDSISLDLDENKKPKKINIVNKIKKVFKKNNFKKKETQSELKKVNFDNFNERNFLEKNNFVKVEKKDEENFAKQNFPKNTEKKENLKLKENNNFILKNLYFIIFVVFTGILVLISFILNYLNKKDILDDEIKKEAWDYEIEEINN